MSAFESLLPLAYLALLAAIAIVDIRTRRVPPSLLLPLALLALLDAALLHSRGPSLPGAIVGGCVGFGVFYLAHLGGQALSRFINRQERRFQGSALGLGDVWLMGAVGLVAGFPGVTAAMLLAILLGGCFAICLLLIRRLRTGRWQGYTTMPYAPGIAASAALTLLFGDQLALWLHLA